MPLREEGAVKLYVWDDFASDYSSGLAVAIASSQEEAMESVRNIFGMDPVHWGKCKVKPLDEPFAVAVRGGS